MNTQLEKEYQEYKESGRIWGLVPQESIKKIKFPRVSKEIIDQFLEIEDLTTTVSDVLDSLGISGAIPASYIPPVIPGKNSWTSGNCEKYTGQKNSYPRICGQRFY